MPAANGLKMLILYFNYFNLNSIRLKHLIKALWSFVHQSVAYLIYFIPLLVSVFIIIFFPNISLCHELDASFLLEPGRNLKIEFDYASLNSTHSMENEPPTLEEYLLNSRLDAKVRKTIEWVWNNLYKSIIILFSTFNIKPNSLSSLKKPPQLWMLFEFWNNNRI